MPYSNAAKKRNPLKYAGVPQTTGSISAASRPKFTILCEHVEDILLLNDFFSDCRNVPYSRRYSPTKLCDGAQMAIFGDFFESCIFGNWTTHGYANSRTANSRTGHLADWLTRRLDNSRTSQLADWTSHGLDNSRPRRCRQKNEN